MKALNNYLRRLHNRIKESKGTFILYTILRLMVLVALIRSIFIHNYEGAAVGFVTIDLLNRNSKNVHLSPLYLTMVAFCFSMTIGVLWEFIECAGYGRPAVQLICCLPYLPD